MIIYNLKYAGEPNGKEWQMKWKPGFFGKVKMGFIWGPIQERLWGNKTLQNIILTAGSDL